MAYPLLYADERGIWREDHPGRPAGILWSEVYRVNGGKLDCFDRVDTTLELDWEYGEYLELNSRWDGFGQVVHALTERLPGIDQDWYCNVEALGVNDPPLVVWQRVTEDAA